MREFMGTRKNHLPARLLAAAFILCILGSAGAPVQSGSFIARTAIAPLEVVRQMLGQVNKDRALTDLRKLTGEEPACTKDGCTTILNRLTGSVGLQQAKGYMIQELASLGYTVEVNNWTRSGYTDQNIIARKPGRSLSNETVYFVAHLDGVKTGAEERFPAADDNGSGAVDLLEAARVLSSYPFERTLVLFFSTGEEEGTLGVQSYLDQISPGELGSIQYVVDIDMVGYDGNNDAGMQLWHGGDPASMVVTQIMSDTIQAYQLNLKPAFIIGCG